MRRNTRSKTELETIKSTLSKRGNLSPRSRKAAHSENEFLETFPQPQNPSRREAKDLLYSSTHPAQITSSSVSTADNYNTTPPSSGGSRRNNQNNNTSSSTRLTPPSDTTRNRNQQSSSGLTPPSSGGSGKSRSQRTDDRNVSGVRNSSNQKTPENISTSSKSSNLDKIKRDISNGDLSSSVSRSMRQPIQDAYSLVNIDYLDNQRKGKSTTTTTVSTTTSKIPVSPIKSQNKNLPDVGSSNPILSQRSPSPMLSSTDSNLFDRVGGGSGGSIDDDNQGSRIDKIYELRRRRQNNVPSSPNNANLGAVNNTDNNGSRSPRRQPTHTTDGSVKAPSSLPIVNSSASSSSSKRDNQRNLGMVPASVLPKGGLGIIGLKNLGNTCFMNAALQCLLATDKLTSYFQTHNELFSTSSAHSSSSSRRLLGGNRGSSSNGSGVANTFNRLVQQCVQSGNNVKPPPIAPQELKTMVARNAPWLIGNQQHDCQEFLRYLLDAISEDLKLINKKNHSESTTTKPQKSANQSEEQSSAESGSSPTSSDSSARPHADDDDDDDDDCGDNNGVDAKKEEKIERKESNKRWKQCQKSSTIVEEVFQGQLRSRVECCVCHHVSFCFDPFLDISVPIPEGAKQLEDARGSGRQRSSRVKCTTLEDCLKSFTEKEILDDENRFMCDCCKKRQRCEKRLTVHRWPSILVIHIKRFQYTTYSREKLSTSVIFPTKGLDLRPYFSHPEDPIEVNSQVSGSGGSSGCDRNSSIYDLYGVSNHMGGLGGGHYTASCRHDHLGGAENKWFLYNDSNVSPLSDESELQGSVAYVLFYKQRKC
jgi:ubiquitin C-terminal hydrolase